MKNKQIREWLAAAFLAAALCLIAGLGLLERADLAASDALYQQASANDGSIVLVGIDQRALAELGPYNQWGRDIMAQAVRALNQQPDCRPAVIGIDVLYAGETEPDADWQLAEAAAEYGNVVVAAVAEFGTELRLDTASGEYRLADFAVQAWDMPYKALRERAAFGHINTMLDTDGILRHHLLYIELPDGERVPSLAAQLAEAYREYKGLPAVNQPPLDEHCFWYLPFCGQPGALTDSISLVDVLSGEYSAEYFADKIVLMGPYAAGLQDSYLTAIDHAQPMYGVEYQANAIQALLWEDYRQEVGGGLQLALLFCLALLAWWLMRGRRPWLAAVAWLGLCLGWLLLCQGLAAMGWLLHVLWVPAGVTTVFVVSLAANYWQAAMSRRQLMLTFQRYVAPQIVDEILREGADELQLGGKTCRIAVLFVDVRGFTAMSEGRSPEQVVEILNRYLELISDCILNHGGTLDKFIGDAAMAFWGAPLFRADYVRQAVAAALAMQAKAGELAAELERDFGESVSFGIGIHVGEAVVGNIGSPRRLDYTAIGDTVNTAERLESKAKGGEVLISRAVLDELAGDLPPAIEAEAGGYMQLKGKKGDIEVFRLKKLV